MPIDHLHEACIHTAREASVVLDHRPVLGHVCLLNVVNALHSVRIAHR